MQTREYPELRIRLPPDLRDWVKSEALANRRTINSEMLFKLEQARKQTMAAGNASQATPAA